MLVSALAGGAGDPNFVLDISSSCKKLPRLPGSRHAKSRDLATIGCGNIFRLWKDKSFNTVEFLELISLNSINDHLLHDASGSSLLNVSERSISA